MRLPGGRAAHKVLKLSGVTLGVAAAEHVFVARRRRHDPAAHEDFAQRRGVRARTIELDDGARIFMEEAGPAGNKGAVFVHGSAMRSDMWHYQLGGIGDHRLVFYDLRGHGRSQPKGDSELSVTTLATDLEAVGRAAGLEEMVVVGHSLGGMVALELCRARRADLGSVIKGLVLINTTPKPPVETLAGGAAAARLERLLRRPVDVLGSQAHRIEMLRRVVRPSDALFWGLSLAAFGPGASARQVDFAYDMLSETPTDVIFDLFKAYRHFDGTDALGEITVPALVIGGTRDHLTVASASEYIARHLPKAELELLEGCGHLVMLERHEELNTMLRSFFDDTLGTSRRE
ncbi:MAG: alpha/beta fold hydrolase [Actinomycetota bacterium]